VKHIQILLVLLFLTACSSDSSSPEDGLPAATQTGANTFGCLIDGKLLVPRNGDGTITNPLSGADLVRGFPEFSFDYYELEITDYKSSHNASLLFHMHNAPANGLGTFLIDESNGFRGIDGLDHNYIHCIIFDATTNSYQKYLSYENSGNFTITRITRASNGNIISGTFSCKLQNVDNPEDEIEITSGRFDINSLTIAFKDFP
jgi:hypothetical protein